MSLTAEEKSRITASRHGLKKPNQRTAHDQEKANDCHKATLTELKQLCRSPDNARCADCDAKYPGWAALPHGVFLCIDCAQVHRAVGRHISQVKSISSGSYVWHPDEVEVMRSMGNRLSAVVYGNTKPRSGGRSHAEAVRLATAKYGSVDIASLTVDSTNASPTETSTGTGTRIGSAQLQKSQPKKANKAKKQPIEGDLLSWDWDEVPAQSESRGMTATGAVPAPPPPLSKRELSDEGRRLLRQSNTCTTQVSATQAPGRCTDFNADFDGVSVQPVGRPIQANMLPGQPTRASAQAQAWDQQAASVLSLYGAGAGTTARQQQAGSAFAAATPTGGFFASYGL